MPLFLKPAASAQHRRACLALYKSLHKTATTIPLPDDVLALSSSLSAENPIRTLIRNSFRRNRKDTSSRLVVSALKNGYRFLSLLSSAAAAAASQGPSSKPYSDVISFLKENTARVLAIKSERDARLASRPRLGPRPPEEEEEEGGGGGGRKHVPIITKISKPGEPPVYVPTRSGPRPISEIPQGKIRKPPRLDMTGFVPFLRLYKPMSPYHERVVRQVAQKRQERVRMILEMQNEEADAAKLEDRWDRDVELLAKMEQKHDEFRRERMGVKEELSFETTMKYAVRALSAVMEEQRVDLVARGRAMWEIERREIEAAKREDEERRQKLRDGITTEEVDEYRRWVKAQERKGRKILKVLGKEEKLRAAAERLEREEKEKEEKEKAEREEVVKEQEGEKADVAEETAEVKAEGKK